MYGERNGGWECFLDVPCEAPCGQSGKDRSSEHERSYACKVMCDGGLHPMGKISEILHGTDTR